jgi:sec-independent protein translocase protein TatA
MFNLGWLEGGLIIVVAVLIFGSKRLPELGGALGKALRGLKEEVSERPSKTDIDKQDF